MLQDLSRYLLKILLADISRYRFLWTGQPNLIEDAEEKVR